MINTSIALHIIGFAFWLGGLLFLTKLMRGAVKLNLPAEFLKKFFNTWVIPGFLITILTGFYQLAYQGMSFYMKQGWFHGKLLLILILFIVTYLVFADLKKYTASKVLSEKKALIYHIITASSFLLIVLFSKIKF